MLRAFKTVINYIVFFSLTFIKRSFRVILYRCMFRAYLIYIPNYFSLFYATIMNANNIGNLGQTEFLKSIQKKISTN